MSDSDDDELLDLLAPDGFPKYYMKKPSGGDPFDYTKPPKQVNMKWRKSKVRKILKAMKILYFLENAKIPKIPKWPKRWGLQNMYEQLPEKTQMIIRNVAKLVDFWLCRAIFYAFPVFIRITILICSISKISNFMDVVCWQKGKWSFSYTRTVIDSLLRSFIMAFLFRSIVFFDDNVIDGPMFSGKLQLFYEPMKGNWIDYFDSFYGKQRIIDFLNCLLPNCGKPFSSIKLSEIRTCSKQIIIISIGFFFYFTVSIHVFD